MLYIGLKEVSLILATLLRIILGDPVGEPEKDVLFKVVLAIHQAQEQDQADADGQQAAMGVRYLYSTGGSVDKMRGLVKKLLPQMSAEKIRQFVGDVVSSYQDEVALGRRVALD